MVIERDNAIAPRIATITQGNIIFSWNHFVPAMPPAYQKARSCPILKYKATPSLNAESSALSAAPASTNRAGVNPPLAKDPIPYTIAAPAPAPTNAYRIRLMNGRFGINAKQSASAKPAPELMPISPESASGLRVIPCIIAPATAKLAPIITPPSTRGSRSSRII
ncbi:hypothetical protein D3C75_823690 [compost metagenome]